MEKRFRQYTGLIGAILGYYFLHEGAHFLYAVCMGVFKTVHFMGIGMQVDIFREQLTDRQLGVFCLAGPAATLAGSVLLVLLCDRICALKSAWVRTFGWYLTLAILLIDPLYMSILYRSFGGGDMNGIRMILPESLVNVLAVLWLAAGLVLVRKRILPAYTESFWKKE